MPFASHPLRDVHFKFLSSFFLLLLIETTHSQSTKPKFLHPTETSDLDCAQFLKQTISAGVSGNNRNADLSEYRRNRIVYPDTENWDSFRMDCRSLFARTYFQREDLYAEEKEFPIAIARTVYKDYRFVEMELASTYTPQNFYCFALDANVSPTFAARMKALAACMPNVLLTKQRFVMDGAGRNVSQSNHECMQLLAQPKYKWKYLIVTENHDVALKTNQELIQVFKWLDGANDMALMRAPADRFDPHADWSFEKLQLFKNESRNHAPVRGAPPRLQLARALSTVALSRAAVDFVVQQLDVSTFLSTVEVTYPSADEILMGTLQTSEAVELPGGFTHRCLRDDAPDYFVSRYAISNGSYCASEMWSNGLCVFGMEHLAELQYVRYLFANKFLPDKDFGALACWHEYLFNRTHLERGTMRLDPRNYLDAPHVRFQRERAKQGDRFDPQKFDCDSSSAAVSRRTGMAGIPLLLFLLTSPLVVR